MKLVGRRNRVFSLILAFLPLGRIQPGLPIKKTFTKSQ